MRWVQLGGERVRRHRVAIATAAGLVLAVVAALRISAGVGDSPSELQLFVGRLHPLIVHLPIGFVLLCVALEALSRTRRFVRVRHTMPLALVSTALGAVAAAAAGYLLRYGGGYSGELVQLHERLGIAVAAGALLTVALWYAAARLRSAALRTAYTGALLATLGITVAAGHFGGTLTRGPEYLTEYMPGPMLAVAAMIPREEVETRAPFTYPDEAVIYEHLVAPVLRERCVSCHGPDKQKGDLRLDSPEEIERGGESGSVLSPGRAAESRLIQRIWLPQGHEDVMPPRGRPPLPAVEAELLRWWIDQGASFDQTLGRAAPPPGVRAILEQVAGPAEERIAAVLRTEVPAADSASLAGAREAGLSLRPIARESNFLRARCAASAPACGGEQVQALLPLAQQLAELDLGGGTVVDDDLAAVGQLRHLTRLSLDRTKVGDAGLAHLDSLLHLEYLNLYGTAVTDAGLAALEPLTGLRSLYLWRTAVTAEGAARLMERLPRVEVSLGMSTAEVDSLAASPDS